MVRAVWHGRVLAESDDTVVVDGRHYFPPDSVRRELFRESTRRTECPWKGEARYLSVEVDGVVNPDAAWYYPDTTPDAAHIKEHVAFWHGIQIEGSGDPFYRSALREPDWTQLGATGV